MKQKSLLLKLLGGGLVVTLLVALSAGVFGTNNTSDPLVTLSYLNGTFKNDVLDDAEKMVSDKANAVESQIQDQKDSLEKAMANQGATVVTNDYTKLTVTSGQSFSVTTGNEILWLSGSATVSSSCLSDTTTGTTLGASGALTVNHLYIATGSGTITATADGTYLIK